MNMFEEKVYFQNLTKETSQTPDVIDFEFKGKRLVSFYPDGRIVLSPNLSIDKASRETWNRLEKMGQGIFSKIRKRAEKAELEIKNLKKQLIS